MSELSDLVPGVREDAEVRGRGGASLALLVGPVSSVSGPRSLEAGNLDGVFHQESPVMATTQADPVDVAEETRALQRLVNSTTGREHAASGDVAAVGGPAVRRRDRGRGTRDWMTTIAAVLAVVAVVAVTAVAVGIVSASSPTADALRTLSQSEAVLNNEIRSIGAARAKIEASRANGLAIAEGLAGPLGAVAGVADEPARAQAEAARVAYLSAVEAIELPEVPEVVENSDLGAESSLSEVAAALDDLTARSAQVDLVATDVDDFNARLATLDADFDAALSAFAETVPPSAAAHVAENSEADEAFREALTTAAAAVARSSVDTLGESLSAYAQAVAALHADEARALEAQARLAEARNSRPPASGGPTVAPTTPVDPTTPVPVEPAPVDPAPVDPAPVDPAPTTPDPAGEG